MAVELQELLLGEQAKSLARMSSDWDNVGSLLARVSVDKFSEVGLLEAASAKELGKAGAGTDLATLRAGWSTPPNVSGN